MAMPQRPVALDMNLSQANVSSAFLTEKNIIFLFRLNVTSEQIYVNIYILF